MVGRGEMGGNRRGISPPRLILTAPMVIVSPTPTPNIHEYTRLLAYIAMAFVYLYTVALFLSCRKFSPILRC